MNKVLLITNIPNPYRLPLFEVLQKQFEARDWRLKVLFGARGYTRRKWQIDLDSQAFAFDILQDKILQTGDRENVSFRYPGLINRIRAEKPDVIITLGFSVATMKVWLLTRFWRIPYIIWSGAIETTFRHSSRLRTWQRRFLVRYASGYIAYGSLAKKYLINLGATPESVHIALNTVETQFFADAVEKARSNGKLEDGKKHLLYVGYLNRRKNVRALLEVVRVLRAQRSDFVLDIVGDGEERAALEEYVCRLNLEQHVIFHGYRQRTELPRFLASADCFLFQTDFDVWGLVLVEAMACGLPCIASRNAGATMDLVKDGETGFTLDFSDHATACERINWLLDSPIRAKQIGQQAQRLISARATLKASATGFMQAIHSVHDKN